MVVVSLCVTFPVIFTNIIIYTGINIFDITSFYVSFRLVEKMYSITTYLYKGVYVNLGETYSNDTSYLTKNLI